jgi:hypothetical protein
VIGNPYSAATERICLVDDGKLALLRREDQQHGHQPALAPLKVTIPSVIICIILIIVSHIILIIFILHLFKPSSHP